MKPPERRIAVESIAAWSQTYRDSDRWGASLERMPAELLDEYEAVHAGETALLLPDGRVFWSPVGGDVDTPRCEGDFGQVLLEYLIDHKAEAHHSGPVFPTVLFGVDLNPAMAFCADCGKWVDLRAESQRIDGRGTRLRGETEHE